MRHLDGPAGRLEARIDEPVGPPRAVAVVAPPHPELGGTLHDRVVYHATQGLIRVGCAVIRFTFRGAGASEGTFTGGPGERDDFHAAIDAAAARYPVLPVWAVGYSFGAWIAADVGAADPRVALLVAIAPADVELRLRRRDRPPASRSSSIHGERDHLALGQGDAALLRHARTSRGSWSSSTAPITCSTATSARSPTPSWIS